MQRKEEEEKHLAKEARQAERAAVAFAQDK
jgi:hypothetical protein